ncbi:hydrolase [Paenibacillus swuensis]|uniref:Hydrolase n=1 Tax=Paenibacillus swuensis TaxID=1178515 RepID=A0A172THT9_9BACL|nr:Cof-type HAD-IIB family hydrolase [Paenibacillus swuensis]ANE46343.1 hydrolase [Paenibacillus swuensis]
MSNYKLITIDIDDTLLNDELQVTDGTKQAMKAAIEQGVVVTLATGRMYDSAQKIAKQINLNVPLITYQGALIKNLLDEQVLYERYVPDDAAAELYDYCEARGYHLQVYINDVVYAKEDNQKIKDYCKLSNVPYRIEPDFRSLLGQPFAKMLMIDDPEVLDAIALELRPLIGDRTHITKSKAHYLEFMHKEGTKGHAVTFLANHYGLELSQVIALGDAWNDHEMIEVAGLGVAMGNAIQPLKEVADYITLSNNEDGVKHVIDKFILNPA